MGLGEEEEETEPLEEPEPEGLADTETLPELEGDPLDVGVAV